MERKLKQYEVSGKFGMYAPFIMLLFGVIGGGIFGAIYTYATRFIPFVYLNFLLTLGLGFMVGLLTYKAGKLGKVRNTKVFVFFAFVNGLIALYVQWVVWIKLVFEGVRVLNPFNLLTLIELVLPHGTWSIGRRSLQFQVSGFPLLLIWIIEAIIIVGIPMIICRSKDVFCEDCSKWAKEDKSFRFLYPENIEKVKSEVESGNFESLKRLTKAENKDDAKEILHLHLKFGKCPECNQLAYITLCLVTYSRDKKEKLVEKSETLLENLILSKEHFYEIEQL